MPELPTALRRYLEVSRQSADSAFHTSQVSISFGEAVETGALRSAWEIVAAAHPALRMTFTPDGSPATADTAEFGWQECDWQASPPADLGAEWQALVQADAAKPIAFGSEPPCRFTVIRLPSGEGHALWSFHGALLDSDSISTALHQWLHAYDCLRTGAGAPIFSTTPEDETPPAGDWKTAFENFTPPHPLLVLPLPASDTPAGTRRSISQTFERPERAGFADAAAAMGSSLRSLFGAAWAFVIARATTSDDTLLLETARTGNAVGRHEGFVVRRCRVEESKTARELVRSLEENAAAPDPQTLAQTLGLCAADLEPATAYLYRDLTLNDRLQLEMPRWMAADTQLFQQTAPPVALRVVATDRPEVALDYDPTRLSDAAARLLFDLYVETLKAFAADPALLLPDFALPGKPAIIEGPEAPATFRSLVPQCLHELFADVAAESPDAIAVEMGGDKLTFSQLNAAANQFARHLRKSGVEPGFRVGIAMPRSPRWITALLGTLKAGASVVPLPESSTEPAAGIKAWIVDALPDGETRPLPVLQAQAEASAIHGEKSRGVQNESSPTAEALVIKDGAATHVFTHENVAASFQSAAAMNGLSPADRILQFAPTDRFAAVEETLSTLLSGATLVLRADSRWATRTAFQEFVQEKAVTAFSVPTPFWSQWTHYLAGLSLQAPPSLRLAVITGPLPSPNAVAAWRSAAGSAQILHRTPALAACGLGLAGEPGEASLLGFPGPATVARLVDKRGLSLPPGLPGGADIAPRGGSFVPLGGETFVSPEGIFHARSALQAMTTGPAPGVLSESIRLTACTHPEVLDAFVDRRLVAARQEWCLWIVPRDSQRGEPHDFRDWLAQHLSTAPRRIRALPRLPLDDAGEIDIAALADLLPDDAAATPAQKGTEEEERMRRAISRALGGRKIELDENIHDGRTKPETAKLLHEAVVREEPRVELADFTAGFSVRSLLRNVRGRKTGESGKWTPLQPLRASGKLPPLVFVHDLDGTTKPYAPLVAHLGSDQPCYAIGARGVSDPAACHASVEEMASAYVEALRVFDASGPYRLAGYGFGGLVAYEMARQLTQAGDEVPLLVLLATEPPGGSSAVSIISDGWKRLFGKKPAEETNGRRRAQDTPVSKANREATRRYTAAPSPLRAHVFAPTEGFPNYRSVQSGWEACCEEVRLYQVPCTGPDMMEEPAVESLAEAISGLTRTEEDAG